jgi:hypothetical protein
MEFDSNGFLIPYEPIFLSLSDFELMLAQNEHRKGIFQTYLAFIESLKTLGIMTFEHWLNGSFVSKKVKPNDLDILIFVSTFDFFKFEKELELLKRTYKSKQLDIFYIIKRTEFDKDFMLYQSDYMEWLHLFSKTRRNLNTGIRHNKSFIQLNFNFDEKR